MSVPSLNLTLTPWEFYVLLALANHNLHGYGIRDQIIHDSAGTIVTPSGTLYPTLNRLISKRLIARTEAPTHTKATYRYRLTPNGRHRLEEEIHRLELAITHAHLKLGHKLSTAGWHT